MPFFTDKKAEEEVFTSDGQRLADGSIRYKVVCDGGISPTGVYWTKTVPPGASKEDYLAAQAERDEAVARLEALTAKA